jgi:soluble lytic murein transglycosylase-like protein
VLKQAKAETIACMIFIRCPILFGLLGLLPVAAVAGDIFVSTGEQESVLLSNVPAGDDFAILVASPVEPELSIRSASDAGVGSRTSKDVIDRAAAFAPLVEAAAHETSLDPRLLQAVIATESGYNPVARSPKGAQGLMQLMPATARRYGVADAYDPRQSILGGARYLSDLMVMFDQDVQLALAAYNAGENAVLRHGRKIPPYQETAAYVPRVLRYYKAFTKTSY